MKSEAELLAQMRRFSPPTVALLGMELLAVDPQAGSSRYRMTVTERLCNPMGNLQGGIITTMLDDTAAISLIVKAGRPIAVPTVEFKVSFFAPAPLGSVVESVGRCVKLGSRIGFAEADLLDTEGKLLARLSTSVVIVEMKGKPLLPHLPQGKHK